MAKDEDLGKLSPEQLQRLANTISEAKGLTNQQADIIESVLAGEHDIGKLRIAYLDQYFDRYSKYLDLIATKHGALNKAFAALADSTVTLDSHTGSKGKKSDRSGKDDTSSKAPAVYPKDTVGSEKVKQLGELNTTDIASLIKEREARMLASQNKIHEFSKRLELARIDGEAVVAEEQKIESEERLKEFRLNKTQEVLEAELKAQELINSLKAEMAFAKSPEAGALRAMASATKDELDSAQELSKKRAEWIAEEERKAKLANNGILDALEAQRIQEQANEKFKHDKENLNKLTQERLKAEQQVAELAKLQKENPELAAAREKQKAEFFEKEKYKLQKEYGRVLTTEELKALRERTEAEYTLNEENLKKIENKRQEYEVAAQQAAELSEFKELNPEAGQALAAAQARFIAEEERKARKKNNDVLTKEERDRIKKLADEEFKLDEKNEKKLGAIQQEADRKKKREAVAATDQKIKNAVTGPLTKEDNLMERFRTLKHMTDGVDDEDKGKAQMAVAIKAISSLVAQLEDKIDKIASYQGGIDTRLQGSSNKKSSGSYWNQLTKDMMSVGAVTPFFKQEDFANNIKSLVEKGISFDLKQRAFLMTIQEKIANTFNVADGTLLRLIRIQQEDSTAGRLGMESALNSFLNNMYETSEYLSDVASSVRGSLEEMESLMKGAEATEVEFQVQKWMGSLYSVGMSQTAVQNIASSLGQIAAGQIDGLTGSNGTGNLLVMAANNAGLSIADILTDGIDASDTNKLLQATVNYLAEIAESSKGNNVVQQQLAGVFGIKASDLRAATNLASKNTDETVFGKYMTYDNMLKQLNNMAGSMYKRTSLGEMMTNIWDNGQYSLASSMANNPVSYLLYKMSSLLEDTTGGIPLPFLNVMGFGVDLETTVADLMRVASLSSGILGSLGSMVSGLGNSFNGRAMLSKMGIGAGSGLQVTPRGVDGGGLANEGGGSESTSSSGYVGNSSGSDVKNSTIQDANDSKKQQMVEAKEQEPANQVDVLNTTVIKMYELLESVSKGDKTLRVRVDNYGLTGATSATALGGVSGLLGASDSSGINGGSAEAGGSGIGSSSNTNNSASGSGSGGTVSLGGWTMT